MGVIGGESAGRNHAMDMRVKLELLVPGVQHAEEADLGTAMSAAGALIEMTAQCGGATPRDGQQHFAVLPADPLAATFDESSSRGADEIGHLQRRPAHLILLR